MRNFSLFRRGLWIASIALATVLCGACSSYFVTTDQKHALVRIDSLVEPSPAIVALTAPYREQMEAEMNRVIGQSTVRMTKPGNQPETLLGNFFAEVLLSETKKIDPDVQIAFGTKGGLRIELPKGEITVGHIYELMPFENKVSILELSGESIGTLADYIAGSGGQPVAGMRMKIKDAKAVDVTINGQRLNKNKIYKLVTYDYLANGGDNSRGLTQSVSRIDLELQVRECLLQFIEDQTRSGRAITSTLDGRVKID